MNLGEFREATKNLDDSTYLVYAHTWHAIRTIAYGSYLGATANRCLIVGDYIDNLDSYGNQVLHKDGDNRP